MPTVLRSAGFRVMIFRRDHTPMHVHIYRGDGMAVVFIDDATLRESYGFKAAELRDACEIVAENREFLLREWARIDPTP